MKNKPVLIFSLLFALACIVISFIEYFLLEVYLAWPIAPIIIILSPGILHYIFFFNMHNAFKRTSMVFPIFIPVLITCLAVFTSFWITTRTYFWSEPWFYVVIYILTYLMLAIPAIMLFYRRNKNNKVDHNH